jgi:hypothetical protein
MSEEVKPIDVPTEIYLGSLQMSKTIGRVMRLDPAPFQGVSTQWFVRSAFFEGNYESAIELAKFERSEYGRLEDAMVGAWLNDLIAYVMNASWSGRRADLLLRMVGTQLIERFRRLADIALEDLIAAIDAKNSDWFERAQRQLREMHIASNDMGIRVIQDLMTAIGEEEGDDAVLAAMEISYNNIWRARYGLWFDMTALERLALSAEGMRSHYGGPGRRGDFEVIDLPDAYLLKFDPCGTGQILRRGDSDREKTAYIPISSLGKVKIGASWNQETKDMPYYCTHCPILLEHFPMRDFGSILRPVHFELDATIPCSWSVPKVAKRGKI